MKIKILDIENDDAFGELFNLKSEKLIKSVNFIENINDRESQIIASLSSINSDILIYGFSSLKLPLLCVMNSSEVSHINFVTDSEEIINRSLQYNYQETEISLRNSNTEDIYFDQINVDDYREKVDFIPLAKSKIKTLKLNIINLDKDYEQNNLKNIFSLIKSKNQICILITKDIKKNKNIIDLKFKKIFNIKNTNLNVICY
ncbi:MAG: hypothetical protein CMI74_09205 [Candidatus Pelagibacter sp.]|nr:hypothetical protein [Candidatus Pelagibacter sp.]|tara:strand:+ start:2329 stop:2934 length:606 start_codon:yes stop_codon:yes gene_type:complete